MKYEFNKHIKSDTISCYKINYSNEVCGTCVNKNKSPCGASIEDVGFNFETIVTCLKYEPMK